ncbi:MAG: hypothetical protein VKP62_09760 [Candidatus Sericytochromatia bacterium]|nr:hypothetical protein [Candidatus Sericytochromatia bacterium]
MKLQLQTITHHPEGGEDPRPPVLVQRVACDPQVLADQMNALMAHLGAIVAIPPAAHEANLKALLRRDLAHLATTAEQAGEATMTLRVLRSARPDQAPGAAEVYDLRYELQGLT